MARTQRRSFTPRAKRSSSTWGRLTSIAPITVAPATKAIIATVNLNNPGISETVRRTRGIVLVHSDQSTLTEHPQGALGFVVVSDLAIAAGAASIPGPVTDSSDDGWFVWQPLLSVVSSGEAFAHLFEFDSKAMRRVEDGFGVAVMVENASADDPFILTFGFSLLSSLS